MEFGGHGREGGTEHYQISENKGIGVKMFMLPMDIFCN